MTKFCPKKETNEFNRRVGNRIKVFRELKGLTQREVANLLGYTSSGTLSLIETGERGLNKIKIAQAAKILDTFPEVLTAEANLSKQELIDMNKFLTIRTNPKHPQHKALLKLIAATK